MVLLSCLTHPTAHGVHHTLSWPSLPLLQQEKSLCVSPTSSLKPYLQLMSYHKNNITICCWMQMIYKNINAYAYLSPVNMFIASPQYPCRQKRPMMPVMSYILDTLPTSASTSKSLLCGSFLNLGADLIVRFSHEFYYWQVVHELLAIRRPLGILRHRLLRLPSKVGGA